MVMDDSQDTVCLNHGFYFYFPRLEALLGNSCIFFDFVTVCSNVFLSAQINISHILEQPVENIVDRIQKLGNVLENITNKIESMEIRVRNGKQRVPIAGRKSKRNNSDTLSIPH